MATEEAAEQQLLLLYELKFLICSKQFYKEEMVSCVTRLQRHEAVNFLF